MSADLDLHGLAGALGMSYYWVQRHWRTLRHDVTGVLLPRPYMGGERFGRPRWTSDVIEARKRGDTGNATSQPQSGPPTGANDPPPPPPTSRVNALLRAAGR